MSKRAELLLPQAEHLPARGKGVHDIEQMARAEAKRARKRRRRLRHLRHQAR